ncbi:UDP-glucose 4-epimerase [Paraphotobacterium marinum]|uniref:UDP-glucose 4-epimerase n=2 Tax=Paraphotobacterium marinum TaxID=1755811 RepID=A0A220VGL5_9GAMM|nr:UDP-glucose 4-epimerase [Paraphotobacterium marinum]
MCIMKILVTGATGFIGGEFVKNTQFDLRCVVRKNKENNFNDVFEIDGLNTNTNWQGAFDGVDVVVHFAGIAQSEQTNQEEYEQINFKGTLKLAEEAASAGVKRFIFISTALVNGNNTNEKPFSEKDKVFPANAYATSKYKAEQSLQSLALKSNMDFVIIRPPVVYGNGVKSNFTTLVKLVKKLPILPFGLAHNSRSYLSVLNFIDFIELCLFNDKVANQTFLISDNESISTKELTNRINGVFGKKTRQLPVPILFLSY